ncbi:MAG: hypothetical protein AB1556_05145 [Bacillota bacterium]
MVKNFRQGIFARPKYPPCPSCGSTNTITARRLRLAAGFGVGIILSIICYVLGFFYPLGRVMIPFLLVTGMIMAVMPSLGKYCCLDCDAYWNPDRPDLIWRPKPPGI